MYRHFESKSALLDEMLVDISERLLAGAHDAIAAGGPAGEVLVRLIDFHIDVLVTKPDLITVQDRDLSSLTPAANHRVRLLQRRYVELWVDVVLDCADTGELPRIGRDEARVRVHAMFGLLNSSPMLPPFPAAALRLSWPPWREQLWASGSSTSPVRRLDRPVDQPSAASRRVTSVRYCWTLRILTPS